MSRSRGSGDCSCLVWAMLEIQRFHDDRIDLGETNDKSLRPVASVARNCGECGE